MWKQKYLGLQRHQALSWFCYAKRRKGEGENANGTTKSKRNYEQVYNFCEEESEAQQRRGRQRHLENNEGETKTFGKDEGGKRERVVVNIGKIY